MANNENQQGRKCDGQCQNCSIIQQSYCSAVRLYNLMLQQGGLYSRLEHLEEAIAGLEKAIARFAPSESVITPIAQEGGGAENRSPKK